MTPYYEGHGVTLYHGDAREVLSALPDACAHCAVTSPPYWGLRDYSTDGQLGLEKTPDEFVGNLVGVFGELRRVLRPEGTFWLNLGETYATGAGKVGDCPGGGEQGERWAGFRGVNEPSSKRVKYKTAAVGPTMQPNRMPIEGLKPKDMCMIPARVAIALQENGWWVRSEISWCKRVPMCESVEDRPTNAVEKIYLLAQSKDYYYDRYAVMESAQDWGKRDRSAYRNGTHDLKLKQHGMSNCDFAETGRNMRNYWVLKPGYEQYAFCGHCRKLFVGRAYHKIPTRIIDGEKVRVCPLCDSNEWIDHFATFPREVPRRAIRAGTSWMGCCFECESPLERVVEKGGKVIAWGKACGGGKTASYHGSGRKDYVGAKVQNPSDVKARVLEGMREVETVDWKRTCKCETDKIRSCVVIDPFHGSGQTMLVAIDEGRRYIGVDINRDYLDMSIARLEEAVSQVKLPMEVGV